MVRRYPSLERFYLADERRVRAVEVDFGAHWRTEWGLPTWRVSWVEDTGELIAVRLWSDPQGRSPVHVIATGLAEIEDAEQLLAGWAGVCGRPGSLVWLLDRCRLAAARA